MQRYQQLNPLGLAVAAGITELLGVLLLGFPMISMMNGYGHMMPGYTFGMGAVWWFTGAILAALAGAVFAWIYNVVNAAKTSALNAPPPSETTKRDKTGPAGPLAS